MKKLFILLSLLIVMSPVLAQDMADADQYPEVDPAEMEGTEFSTPRGLPPTDYEEVSREEQQYVPEQNLMDEMPPEEVYETDEEYLE